MITDKSELIAQIADELRPLSHRRLEFIREIAQYLQNPVSYTAEDNSSLVDIMFAEEMKDQLRLHHATHESPLNKKPFEYAFKQCLIAQGHSEADLNPKPGESAYDVHSDNERWSLKTEAGKSLSRTRICIEKFSEARWIREADTPERCIEKLQTTLLDHMKGYDRILSLRCKTLPEEFEYMLDEVPKSLLEDSIMAATPAMFYKKSHGNKDGISFGADFTNPVNGEKLFRMLLDSSVEKIRLWIRAEHCIRHGIWVVQKPESTTSAIHPNEG